MKQKETAPPLERWPEHLKAIGDRELTELAGDYCWLTERNKPQEQRAEFRKRREAIIAECERRGIPEAAQNCRPAAGAMEGD
jgi:hypothetical protein